MSKFFIKIGTFNKIISIPFLLSLVQIIITICELFYPEKIKCPLINFYPDAFFRLQLKKKKQNVSVQKKIVYIILF